MGSDDNDDGDDGDGKDGGRGNGSGDNVNKMRLPTIKDMPQLEYTEKVLRESMRLYPPAWTIGRQSLNDYKVGKYVMPAGSIILVSQYVMHRDPLCFPDPDVFYPDRWTKETKSHLPRFSYFPFGGGIRVVWVSHLHGWEGYC